MFGTHKTRMSEGKVAYKVAKSTQDLIPIQGIVDNDGMFLVDNRYTKSYRIKDINYKISSYEYREDICSKYADIINSIDDDALVKITIYNRPFKIEDADTNLFININRAKNPIQKQVISEYNDIFKYDIEHSRGIIQNKYITISVKKPTRQEAVNFFERVSSDIAIQFQEIGSGLEELSTNERLLIFHTIFNRNDTYHYEFDVNNVYFKKDFVNYIAPNNIERKKNYLIVNDSLYIRCFYLLNYPAVLNDELVSLITDVSQNMLYSFDIIPVPIEEAKEAVSKLSRDVEENIQEWSEKRSKNGDFASELPLGLKDRRDGCNEWSEDLNKNDERMMLCTMTIMLSADSLEELNAMSESLSATVRSASGGKTQLDIATFQQQDVLDTCIPYGTIRVSQCRTLNSSSVAVLTPFKAYDVNSSNGIHLGVNEISRNIITPNIEELLNQSCITLGKTGGGKSAMAKWIQGQRLLKDDKSRYIIVDPESEYVPYLSQLCPEDIQVVRLVAGGNTTLNCLELTNDYQIDNGTSDPIAIKSQFVLSLLNQADPIHPISLEEKSLIDRCIKSIYSKSALNNTIPTLTTLRKEVELQPEEEASSLALKLEIFTEGSLNIFGRESNVNLNEKRVVVFDLFGMHEQLKPIALFVLTDTLINMVNTNWRRNITTYIDFDEYQVLFANSATAAFFDAAYRQWRKRLGRPNAITQNASTILNNNIARNMLSNSEMVILLPQAEADLAALGELYNLSEEQTKWVKKSKAGCGLLKYGDSFIPFSNIIPNTTMIYRLISTKQNEGAFGSNG